MRTPGGRDLAPVLAALLAAAAAATDRAAAGETWVRTAEHPELGTHLVDGRGRALYVFSADGRGESRCRDACADAWPPLIEGGRPEAGRGVSAGRLKSFERDDGRWQVMYDGQPLYRYAGDDAPGDVRGHGSGRFGGQWQLLAPSGRRLEAGTQ